MEELFLIKNNRYLHKKYLVDVYIQKVPEVGTFVSNCLWTKHQDYAIHFTSEEEAQATIDFIINVIDEQYDGCLEVVKSQGN